MPIVKKLKTYRIITKNWCTRNLKNQQDTQLAPQETLSRERWYSADGERSDITKMDRIYTRAIWGWSRWFTSNTKDIDGPDILKDEVRFAIKHLKRNKACGPDNIFAELLHATEEFSVEKITEIANDIYNSGEIPDDLSKSIFIALPKKPGATECELHRTISLMSVVLKVILRILMQRMRNKIRPEINKTQCGFMNYWGMSVKGPQKWKKISTCASLTLIRHLIEFDTADYSICYKIWIQMEKTCIVKDHTAC